MSASLSEKAKGKQRAVPVEAPPAEGPPPSKDLTIRFTEGIPDLTVQVAEKDTVKDVKDSVRVQCLRPRFGLLILVSDSPSTS